MTVQLLCRFLFLVLALGLVQYSAAQDGTEDYALRIGKPDFAVVLPLEHGHYDASNGSLHLDIPLGSIPQRAGKAAQVKLTYDSKLYSWGYFPYAGGYTWQPNNVHGSEGGWKVVVVGGEIDFLASGCSTVPNNQPCTGANWSIIGTTACDTGDPNNPGEVQTTGAWSLETPDGVTRSFLMAQTAMANPTLGSCALADNPNGSAFADDGSGYFISITNYTQATFYDPAGNQVGFKDTNGNYVSTDANGNLIDEIGRTPVIKSTNGNLEYYDILNSQGGRSRYTLTKTTFNVNTAFGKPNYVEYSGPVTTIQSLTLPNGTSYTFGYDATYGLLTSMTLPTGGVIQYGYQVFVDAHCEWSPWLTSRTSLGNPWTYTPAILTENVTCDGSSYGSGTQQVTVTNPDKNYSTYVFSVPNQFGTWNTAATYFTAAGYTLKSVTKDYFIPSGSIPPPTPVYAVGNFELPIRLTTVVPIMGGNITKKTEYDYDNCINVSEVREWDWYNGAAPSTPTRITDANYTCASSVYFPLNMLTRPTSITVQDGSKNVVTQASVEYDKYTLGLSGSGAVQHDSNFGTSYTTRGNVTAQQRWRNTDNVWLTTRQQYDDAGNVLSIQDPLGNTTSYSYADSWGNGTCAPSSGNAAAYQTKVTDALNFTHTLKYNSCTGTVASTTDANQHTTSFSYNDSLDRLTQTTYPPDASNNSPQTTVTYSDAPLPASVTTTTTITPSLNRISTVTVDGLGRQSNTQLDDSQGNILTDTTYDSVGRISSVTTPYRTTKDSTYGLTQTQYDGLDRVTQVTRPDGSAVVTTYIGRATEVQDEGNGHSLVTRIGQTDGLGRLVSVCEVTSATQSGGNTPAACGQDIAATGFLATYQYNLLGDLTGISQGVLTRSFTYDSLSELLSATNPESGTATYTYDNNKNVLTRTRPAPNQNNPQVTVTTTYQYDALNRITKQSYSDGVTPTIIRNYDTTKELGVSLTNTNGRLSAQYAETASGAILSGEIFSYDSNGRIVDNSQCTPQNCSTPARFPINYTYDLLGMPSSMTNGTGTTFSYAYDNAGRLSALTSSLVDANHPATLFSETKYSPVSLWATASLGNVLNESFIYDCRGRLIFYASAVAPGSPAQSAANSSGCPNATAMASIIEHPPGLPNSYLAQLFASNLHASKASILLSTSRGERKRDHGMVTLTLAPFEITQGSSKITVSYRGGDTSSQIAGKLARMINADRRYPIRAAVKQVGLATILEVSSEPGSASTNFSLFASVSSNRQTPSVTATVLRIQKRPTLVGQLRLSAMEAK